MHITSILTCSNFNGKSKQMPRYLYHLTNEDNYKKIQDSGILRISYRLPQGVYLLDLQNFLKLWHKSPEWNYAQADLRLALLQKASNATGKIVLLKIPTSKLEKADKLRIRSQQKLYTYKYPEFDSLSNPDFVHVAEGLPVSQARKLKRANQAIEYIYPSDISVDKIERIGSVDTSKFNFETYNIPNIMKELLKGQPEEKVINFVS